MNFVNILYLGGLSLIIIPIILHLWRRKTELVIPFPAIKYLLRAQQRFRKNLIFNDVILMILRIILITLLALAFSQPYLGSPLAKEGDKRNSLILIDTSMSMCAKNLIKKAKEEAKRIVELNPEETLIATFNENIDQQYRGDTEGAKGFIDRINCTYLKTDVYNSLREGATMLGDGEKEIYLVTDLRDHGWDTKRISELLAEERINLVLLPILDENIKNFFINDVTVKKSKEGVKIIAGIRAEPGVKDKTEVTLFVKNSPPVKTSIFPGDPAIFTLQSFTGEGYIELSEDDLKEDNRRYFHTPEEENIRILVVDGEPDPRPYRSESFFLHKALDALNLPAAKTITPALLKSLDYSDYNIFFLLNIPPIDETLFKNILQRISNGAGLLISTGDNADLNWLTKYISQRMDVTFEAIQTGDFHITDFLKGDNSKVLQEFNFTKRVLILPKGTDFSAPVRFSDGTPLVLSIPMGAGRVILFASSMDIDWTNFPLSGMFVPFVHKVLQELTSTTQRKILMNLTTGRHRIDKGRTDGVILLIDPEGRKKELKPIGGFLDLDLKIPGFWTLKDYLLIVNTSPEESDLRSLEINQVLKKLGDRASVRRPGEKIRGGRFYPLWPLFLAGAGIFIALEAIGSGRR